MELAGAGRQAGVQPPSEGRSFSNRCLAIADGFYEFTAPDDPR